MNKNDNQENKYDKVIGELDLTKSNSVTDNKEYITIHKGSAYKFVDTGCHVVVSVDEKVWGVPQGSHFLRALLNDIEKLQEPKEVSDNVLIDNAIEDLLMAAYRKAVILKLASIGAPIDQDKVDTLCGLLGHSAVLTKAIDKELDKVMYATLGITLDSQLDSYLVVADAGHTRDVEIHSEVIIESACSDKWLMVDGVEVVIGIFKTISNEQAISQCACDSSVDPGILKAYKLTEVQ